MQAPLCPSVPAAECPLLTPHAFRAASDVPVYGAIWLHSGFDIAWQHRQGRIRNEFDDVPSLPEPHGPDGAMAERGRTGIEISQPRAAGRLRQTVRPARRGAGTDLAHLPDLYPPGLRHRQSAGR